MGPDLAGGGRVAGLKRGLAGLVGVLEDVDEGGGRRVADDREELDALGP